MLTFPPTHTICKSHLKYSHVENQSFKVKGSCEDCIVWQCFSLCSYQFWSEER